MKILKNYGNSVNERHITEAVDALHDGHIIIYPTDTVYGMAVDALNKKAVERLCRLRNLDPERNILSIVCSNLSQASEYARIDNAAYNIVKDYIPGPYTFVLPAATRLSRIFKGRRTIGLRIPDNDIARALAEAMGNPLLTGSVDIYSEDPDAGCEPEALAMTYARDVAIVIDNGRSGSTASTVVDLTDTDNPTILRQGQGIF